MANDLNSCDFIGRLGADPEVRTFPSGGQITQIRIACGSAWRDKATGEKKERTEWVPVVFHGKLAEIAAQYLTKGSRVFIRGEFRTRKWQDQSGQDRYSTEVVVGMNGTMQMLDSKPQGNGQPTGQQGWQQQQPAPQSSPAATPPPDFDDDIPF